jgi:DNA end-binding protein Ku
MARPVWKGTISFGLVSVPVKAHTAVRDHTVHFHQLEKGTGARVRHEKVSDKTHEHLDADDIELGYEVGRGSYVTFEKGELEDLQPASTKALEVSDFVELAAIDPIYYERTYWLAPDGDGAGHAYRLLLAVMEAEQRVGIATVVMRNKQYLAAIRPLDGALAMSTMRFADEVVPRSEIDDLPRKGAKPDAKEMKLATQILDALATDWDPTRYHDTYTEELRDLIARRAKGETIEVEEAEPEQETNVVDLMAALEASVAAARGGGGRAKASSTKAKGSGRASSGGSKAASGGRQRAGAKSGAASARKSRNGRAQTKRKTASGKARTTTASRRSA